MHCELIFYIKQIRFCTILPGYWSKCVCTCFFSWHRVHLIWHACLLRDAEIGPLEAQVAICRPPWRSMPRPPVETTSILHSGSLQTQDVEPMLSHRLRRWANIGSTSWVCWFISTFKATVLFTKKSQWSELIHLWVNWSIYFCLCLRIILMYTYC